MTGFEFITLMYTVSVVVAGFYNTMTIDAIKRGIAAKSVMSGANYSPRKIVVSAWSGVIITAFTPIFNTWLTVIILITAGIHAGKKS